MWRAVIHSYAGERELDHPQGIRSNTSQPPLTMLAAPRHYLQPFAGSARGPGWATPRSRSGLLIMALLTELPVAVARARSNRRDSMETTKVLSGLADCGPGSPIVALGTRAFRFPVTRNFRWQRPRPNPRA